MHQKNQFNNNEKKYQPTSLLCHFLWVAQQLNQSQKKNQEKVPFVWEAASVYFLMTDRFYNGDKSNDTNFNRTKTGKLRGFEGGDIKESQKKIDEGYFDKLGINAICLHQ
jgi:alpha-amylase